MDRQSTIGFILIFVVLVVWMWLNSPVQKPKPMEQTTKSEQMKDTVKVNRPKPPEQKEKQEINPYGKFFSDRAIGTEKIISIETDFYSAEVSTKGGKLRKWELKKFKTWDGHPVQLVDYTQSGDFAVLLTTSDGRVINTKDLYFDVQSSNNTIEIQGNFEFEITFTLPASNGGQLVKKMKFRNEEYGFETEIQLLNLSSVIANYQYEVSWEHGIRYAEQNSVDESGFAAAYAYAGSELTEIDAAKVDQKVQKEFSGAVDWVAARNKYFAIAIIPTGNVSEGA
jgi:YidC/Oxa1 family membrane protein insertase